MEAAFEKTFYISSELLRMQEFGGFANSVHHLAKCNDKNCSIDDFSKKKLGKSFLMKSSVTTKEGYFLQTFVILIYLSLMQCFNFTIRVRKTYTELNCCVRTLQIFYNVSLPVKKDQKN